MSESGYNIAIIGAGKVGAAVGYLLRRKGHRIAVAVTASEASLEKAALYLPGARLVRDTGEAPADSYITADLDVILITTKDGQIESACKKLAAGGGLTPSQTVIHMSGAAGLDLLSSAKEAGAGVASLHPIQSFAGIELAVERLPGSYFGLTAEGTAREVALRIAADLDGKVVEVADGHKTLYHAAACVASNYLVTLVYTAQKLYAAAGFEERAAVEAMMPLIKGTLANIESVGAAPALTGPIARGDAETVERHLKKLVVMDEEIIETYRMLGLRTVDMAVTNGGLRPEVAAKLYAALKAEHG
ncbi:MAG: DUF2520 domain-containing protein [Actinobacteria bacterium]|nr:DUF2520 domain-containing protein [Actinomycetota bacterium]